MKVLMIISCFISFIVSTSCFSQTRNGIFNSKNLADTEPGFSTLSLGTMMGLSYSFDKAISYRIVNRVVKIEDEGDGFDRLLPSIYALPSINLIGVPGKSLSAIVPANLNTDKELSLGVGLSYGFSVRNSVEIGLSTILVWANSQNLNREQEESLRNNLALPEGEALEIGLRKRPSFGIGIYMIPLLIKK